MIENTDLLNTLAQISLGTLGFTGVVVALKHDSADWNNIEKISFQALVATTLTALAGSLLPQIIDIALKDDFMVWRLANLGIGILHLTNFIAILFMAKKYNIETSQAKIKDIGDSFIGVTLIVFHLIAALGYIPWLQLLLVIGVLQQLYIGIGNFLKLVRWS